MPKKKLALDKVKEYYTLTVIEGRSKAEALPSVFGLEVKNSSLVENSEEYKLVAAALDQSIRTELKKEMGEIQKARLESYKKLLAKGDELVEKSDSIDKAVLAHRMQRENLTTGIIDSVENWSGDKRNQQDYGDVLEGVIIP